MFIGVCGDVLKPNAGAKGKGILAAVPENDQQILLSLIADPGGKVVDDSDAGRNQSGKLVRLKRRPDSGPARP